MSGSLCSFQSFRGKIHTAAGAYASETAELKANAWGVCLLLGQMYTVAYGIGNRPDTNLGPVPAQAGRHASYS